MIECSECLEYPEYRKKQKIEDDVTDHKYHTHSNEQFPLATKTQPLLSHTAFILTPLAKPNNMKKQYEITQFYQEFNMQGSKQLSKATHKMYRNAKQL